MPDLGRSDVTDAMVERAARAWCENDWGDDYQWISYVQRARDLLERAVGADEPEPTPRGQSE